MNKGNMLLGKVAVITGSGRGIGRGMHTDKGWTPESIAERAMPALKPSFTPLETSGQVFTWDPV